MKSIRTLFAAAVLSAIAVMPAAAQTDYPSKPIKIIAPYSPGGIVDTLARLIGDKLSLKYGQSVIVENMPGAGGGIGMGFVAKAPADGYTLLLVSPAYAVLPSLQKSVHWNPVRNFRSVAGIGVVPNIFVVHPSVPVKTMKELVELARKSDSPLTYATAGIGTSNHLSGELLAQEAHIKLTQIPYKGQPKALPDVLAGRVPLMPLTTALALPYIKSGKLRPLAVTTARRSTALPELPTVAEALDLPSYAVGTWFGLVAPKEVPDAIINKLAKDVADILANTEMRAKFVAMGLELNPQTPAEFDSYMADEFARWSKVIKQSGIDPS